MGVSPELPFGDGLVQGRVTNRARDNDGNVIGRAHGSPILDTRKYIVAFEDGEEAELSANAIAQSMYAQCDPEGNQYVLFDSIVDYRRSTTSLTKADQKVVKANGRTFLRRSTKCWQLCVQRKDDSTSWERLADLKETHPLECAGYAVSQDLVDELAFNWWVPWVLKKRQHIVSKVKTRSVRYLKRNQKFGIALPKSVKEAEALDKANDNTYWMDALAKEMKNTKVAFKILPEGEMAPRDHQFVKCHIVWDVKMKDFRRTASQAGSRGTRDYSPCCYYLR